MQLFQTRLIKQMGVERLGEHFSSGKYEKFNKPVGQTGTFISSEQTSTEDIRRSIFMRTCVMGLHIYDQTKSQIQDPRKNRLTLNTLGKGPSV